MAKKEYDKILTRLVKILTMLTYDERPTIKYLSLEFNVSIRTIQDDVYKKLQGFSIEKDTNKRLKFKDGFNLLQFQIK